MADAKRRPSGSKSSKVGRATRRKRFDVIVVGGGPAGSTMSWKLAKRGLNVLVLDKAAFPREKVCGDFVEPRGLRILDEMGCLKKLEDRDPLPISRVAMYLQSECRYQGPIPFYGRHDDLPPHGYIIARYDLDSTMLEAAEQAGAVVFEETTAKEITFEKERVVVGAVRHGNPLEFYAPLLVGADGCNSVVAKSVGLNESDPRYIAVSKRCYAEGADLGDGEAAFFFDRDTFPGYAWMFPMSTTRANIGVGILSEARNRYNLSVPKLLDRFVQQLRDVHPDCKNIEPSSRPIGGIVKTYGGAGKNYFDRGILIGDAGCFVDPMTGEGITPAMESALLGAEVLVAALEAKQFDAEFLSEYHRSFRGYFDPAMQMLDLVAAIMRNRHFADSWLNLVGKGCELSAKDEGFARLAGGTFGGMEVVPVQIGMAVWLKAITAIGTNGLEAMQGFATGNVGPALHLFRDSFDWQLSWWKSVMDDPVWHAGWWSDVLG
ncbi:MAG: NAD(P)/FAD-dependent oxidoreductase, partial [Rhodothermales bacterium]